MKVLGRKGRWQKRISNFNWLSTPVALKQSSKLFLIVSASNTQQIYASARVFFFFYMPLHFGLDFKYILAH
jgi:hypothetical protein